jgi:hypothetical protein
MEAWAIAFIIMASNESHLAALQLDRVLRSFEETDSAYNRSGSQADTVEREMAPRMAIDIIADVRAKVVLSSRVSRGLYINSV